jgi:hypothetical protein
VYDASPGYESAPDQVQAPLCDPPLELLLVLDPLELLLVLDPLELLLVLDEALASGVGVTPELPPSAAAPELPEVAGAPELAPDPELVPELATPPLVPELVVPPEPFGFAEPELPPELVALSPLEVPSSPAPPLNPGFDVELQAATPRTAAQAQTTPAPRFTWRSW